MTNKSSVPKDLVVQVYGYSGWCDVRIFHRNNFDKAIQFCERLHKKEKWARTRVALRRAGTDRLVEDVRIYPYQKDKTGNYIIPNLGQ